MSLLSRTLKRFHRPRASALPTPPALLESLESRTLMAVISDPALGALALRMTVDYATGAATLSNTSGADILVDGYQIASTAGSLDPAGWHSITDAINANINAVQAVLGPNAFDFIEYSPKATNLTEATLNGYADFAPGGSWAIGNPVLPEAAAAGDLKMYFLLTSTAPGNMLLGDLVITPGAATTIAVDALSTLDTTPQLTGTVNNPAASVSVSVNGHSYAAVNNGDGTWTLPDNTIAPTLAFTTFSVTAAASVDGHVVATDPTSSELTVVAPPPPVSIVRIKDGKETNGATTAGMARFLVSRVTTATAAALVVHYSVDGASTATAGDDFTVSGAVTIPAGKPSVFLDVPIVDDALAEPTESFTLTLTSDLAYTFVAGKTSATATITDNEPTVSITRNKDGKETGGATTAGMARFLVARAGGNNAASLDVAYTVGGTATPGDDYTALPGTVTIPAGKASVFITIPIVDDAVVDPSETIALTLPASTAYRLAAGKTSAAVTIADNEPVVSIARTRDGRESTGSTTGMARFTVSRAGGLTTGDLVVHYSIAPSSTATAGDDYTALSGTVTIPAGSRTAFINVPILPDLLADPGETLTLTLSADPAYTISAARPSATITILGP